MDEPYCDVRLCFSLAEVTIALGEKQLHLCDTCAVHLGAREQTVADRRANVRAPRGPV